MNASLGQSSMRSLAEKLAGFEPVILGKPPALIAEDLPDEVEIIDLDYDDIWVRDTGPTILVSEQGGRIAIDWKFNSWGGLLGNYDADDNVAAAIARYHGIPCFQAPIVLEGGAITTDGAGSLFTTDESVLAENRNPDLTRSEAETVFRHFLNCHNVIWFPRGLANDEAGGHVDNLMSFADETTILLASTSDTNHPSYEVLKEARSILSGSRNVNGCQYDIVPVPLPDQTAISPEEASGFGTSGGSIVRTPGSPLAPSYINYYLAKNSVFLPIFGSASDAVALDLFSEVFADRTVVPIASREFLLGGGAVHCLTCEIPAKRSN